MSPAAVPPPSARAPIGSTATVRARLARQRPRPLLIRLHAALLGDAGIVGGPARRRAARFLGRSLPAAVAVAAGTLLVLGAFDVNPPGWPQIGGIAAIGALLAWGVWRRAVRAAAGRAAGYREQIELGSLFVVGAAVLVRASAGGAAEPPLQPVDYLVMAFLVAFLARPVGLGLVALAVGLEVAGFWLRGARAVEEPRLAAHAGFLLLFAALYHGVLAAQIAATRRAERQAIARRLREIEERAAEFRLLAPGSADGSPGERGLRWTEGAVTEIEAAVRGAVDVASAALRSNTCAVYLLSADDARLVRRECRSGSDALAESLPAGEGAIGGAVRRRAPVRLHGEVKAATHYLDGTRPGALLAVPLVDRRGGHVRGVVVADRLEARPFDEGDERLLVTIAAEILRAVAAERLLDDMKQTRDETERFFQAIERLNRATKLDDVAAVTLEVAAAIAGGVDFGALTLCERVDGENRHRVVRASRGQGKTPALDGLVFGDEEGSLVTAAVRLDASLPGKEIDVGRAVIFDAATRLRGLTSLRVVPLRAQPLAREDPPVLGTLVLGSSRPGAFTRDLTRQLEVVAMQAAESIQRARLFEATERLATTDGLTGLVNHRTFQGRLEEHLQAAQRHGRTLSIILCDIDHFKSVNDTYGHPVGDQVLRGVARILAAQARVTDLAARYGGEEFAVVMPETDTTGAMVIAERIRERVAALVTETGQGPLQVTLSLGVATFPADAARKPELVERADACLYHAKRGGRNRAVSAAQLRVASRRAGP